MTPLFVIAAFFLTLISCQSLPKVSTWSGGHSGIPLNGSETEIYSVESSTGGVFTHFWVCLYALFF